VYRHGDHIAVWRLIDTGPLSGVENMAVDEALLQHFDPVTSLPILRLYGWQPAALSIGRFQKAVDDLDLERCRADQLSVVRRITGGGAIYHNGELTYSIICGPQQIPAAATTKDSFRVLTSFLLGLYRALGLQADYAVDLAPAGCRLGARTPLCFAGRESYDILVNGRKLGGNAQRRLRRVIFQHGSIPLEERVEDGGAYLLCKPDGLRSTVTSLFSEGICESIDGLKQTLLQQFSLQLGAELRLRGLTCGEQDTAQRLSEEKYASAHWNLEGTEP
jgi:lipoate-protein ligase A